MSNNKKATKVPISQDRIFLITMILTVVVSAVFLVKNLMGGNVQSAIIIGVCLVVFGVAVFIMRKLDVAPTVQKTLLCILLVVLVLLISLTSGSFYSDDFPLYLALIALTGLYLEPQCSLIQIIAIDIALVIMYVLHPEKAETMAQYIMCFAIFNVAAFLNYMVIRRGRAFIEVADARAAEAEHLLGTVKTMGAELEHSYSDSSQGFAGLRAANQRLEQNTHTLMQGSQAVLMESQALAQACSDVQSCANTTSDTVTVMADGLHKMEGIMAGSKDPMQAMHSQLKDISDTVDQTRQVFDLLQEQIQRISGLTGQLNTIAFNTKLLALNASVEAARAGEFGAGFSVVAGEVEALAADSSGCSTQVTDVVEQIKKQVDISGQQLAESHRAVEELRSTLVRLDNGFMGMGGVFQLLFQTLDVQEQNFSHMDQLFDALQSKMSDMNQSTGENRAAAEAIVSAMNAYKTHATRIMDDAKGLRDLSVSLIQNSEQ